LLDMLFVTYKADNNPLIPRMHGFYLF